jgi:hypothetical protein
MSSKVKTNEKLKTREDRYSKVVRKYADLYLHAYEKAAEKDEHIKWSEDRFDFEVLLENFGEALLKISSHYQKSREHYIILPIRKPVTLYKVLKVTLFDELKEILEMYFEWDSKKELQSAVDNEIRSITDFISSGF